MENIYMVHFAPYSAAVRNSSLTVATQRTMLSYVRRVLTSGADLASADSIDSFIDVQPVSVRAPMKTAWRGFVEHLRECGLTPLPALPSPGIKGRPPKRPTPVDLLILALHEAGVSYGSMSLLYWQNVRRGGGGAVLLPLDTGDVVSAPLALIRELHKTFFPNHGTPPSDAPMIPTEPEKLEARPDWSLQASGRSALAAVKAGHVKRWEPPPSDNFD